MKLVLEDGRTFAGTPFGADAEVTGEVVFNTGLTGYVEALTDPSYHGQILVLTYPLQGNYGVPDGPFESARIRPRGLVVAKYAPEKAHHAAVRTLGDWLRAEGVPAIEGIDTRTLTRHLRDHGTMPGALLGREAASAETIAGVDMASAARAVACPEIVRIAGGDPRLLVVDTGAKESIVRVLLKRGATIVRAPFYADWESLLDEVDGVVLTNGPGDPTALAPLVQRIRGLLARGIPTFGICLGHQLLALAAGATTFKMKYGHRSHNQPVQNQVTHRAYVTSQNHGYTVDPASLPLDWEPWFLNLNDGTNEGLRHSFRPFRSVQFHPEAAAGPHDTAHLLDDFIHIAMQMAMTKKRARVHP